MEDKKPIIDLGLNLYEVNQQLMENEEALDPIEKNKKIIELVKTVMKRKKNKTSYWMLMCKHRSDWTVFRITDSATEDDLIAELSVTLNNRGAIQSVEMVDDESMPYEIWIKDDKSYCYYFFCYDNGVVEV